jgi:hypothetical protein
MMWESFMMACAVVAFFVAFIAVVFCLAGAAHALVSRGHGWLTLLLGGTLFFGLTWLFVYSTMMLELSKS